MNHHASELGKMSAGKPKRRSPEAIQARVENMKKAREGRNKRRMERLAKEARRGL